MSPDAPLRILLVSPKGPLYRHRGGIFRRSLRYMPLTLPTLAALLPADVETELTCVDEGIQDVDPAFDADLIGMTVITGTAPRAYELSRSFRARGRTVVLGGPHVTLVPEDAAPHADAIVLGDAEDTWPELVRDVARGTLKPRYQALPNVDLSQRPHPDRSVLPRRRYLTSNVFEATRGCVHDCEFCVVPSIHGRRPRQRPVDDVIADLRATGARRAIFIDLNIIADRNYARRLFRAMIPLRIQWYGLATVLLARDEQLLDLIAESGCRGLLIGFESLNEASLEGARKSFNAADSYRHVVESLHARRIAIQGCFVFGFDADTPDIFERTAQFAVDVGIDLPRFAMLTPFPGTPLFTRLQSQGRILTTNWELYDGQHAVFQPAHMSVRELVDGTAWAWRHAYSIPNIAKRLRRGVAPWPVALTTNAGYRHYAHRLDRFYTCSGMTAPDAIHAFHALTVRKTSHAT